MGSGPGKAKNPASNNPAKPYTQNTGNTQKTLKKEKPKEVIIAGGDSINQKEKKVDRAVKENYIICKFKDNKNDSKKEIRLIHGYEENIKFIEENCEFLIGNNKIEFQTKYKYEANNQFDFKINCKSPLENINYLFTNCRNLIEINLSHFNSSKVTKAISVFYQCISLNKIDLSNFNCNNLIDMSGMFGNCINLKEIILPKNTEKVNKMSGLFYNCNNLSNLDFSNFKTNNVTDMSDMFFQCSKLNELNLSNFNTEKVINMKNMFVDCCY